MLARPALAVSLYVAGRRCVVVGEGPEADDRAQRLLAAGAEVVRLAPGDFDDAAFDGASMVFACDATSAPRVSSSARALGVMVYVLDQPDLSDLAMPALARRGPLSLAVATDGAAPALAARLREELQRLLDDAGPDLDALLDDLVALRSSAPPGPERRALLKQEATRLVVDGAIRIA